MAKNLDDIKSAIIRKFVDQAWTSIAPSAAAILFAVWAYARHAPAIVLLIAGALLGAVAMLVIAAVYRRIRRPTRDPRVIYDDLVSISQDFWIPHGVHEGYRIDFPMTFAEAPAFVGPPWPTDLCQVTQSAGKPDLSGFMLITSEGFSRGDGKGIKFKYTVKGRLVGKSFRS